MVRLSALIKSGELSLLCNDCPAAVPSWLQAGSHGLLDHIVVVLAKAKPAKKQKTDRKLSKAIENHQN